MMKTATVGSLIATLACGSASAEIMPTMDGVFSFGISTGSIESAGEGSADSLDIWRGDVSADMALRFNTSISMGFEFSHNQTTISFDEGEGPSDSFEQDATRWAIKPRYDLNDMFHVGAYYQNTSFIGSLDSVGVSGGYDAGRFAIAGYAGQTELDSFLFFGPSDGIKAKNVGVSALGRPVEGLEIFGHYSLAKIETDAESEGPFESDDEIKLAAVGVDYSFGNGWNVYGATTSTEGSFLGDERLRQSTLGAGFDLANLGGGLPGTMYVDWTRTSFDAFDEKIDAFGVNWTVGFGGADAKPQNCTVRNARGMNPAAFSALIECVPGQFGFPT